MSRCLRPQDCHSSWLADSMINKISLHPHRPVHAGVFDHPPSWLARPVWSDMTPVNVTAQYRQQMSMLSHLLIQCTVNCGRFVGCQPPTNRPVRTAQNSPFAVKFTETTRLRGSVYSWLLSAADSELKRKVIYADQSRLCNGVVFVQADSWNMWNSLQFQTTVMLIIGQPFSNWTAWRDTYHGWHVLVNCF